MCFQAGQQRPGRQGERAAFDDQYVRAQTGVGAASALHTDGSSPGRQASPGAYNTRMARKSFTLVFVGPVNTRSPSGSKKP